MGTRTKLSFSLVTASSLWGLHAHAQGAPVPGPPAEPGARATTDPIESPSNVAASAPLSSSDQELLNMSQQETIEIYDERPDKPFDRDTEVRLTGAQLAARGAVDLGTALALLPDVTVRDAGRGGYNVDIRGARQGSVAVVIDGVSVTDPYYGTFDVSSIPITDIVQIRVATTSQSPIDGPGGPGGVIEVHTRDAIGPQLEIIRLYGDTLPTFGITGTARVMLTKHLALRISMSEQAGSHQYDVPNNQQIDRSNYSSTGAARLEYRSGQLRVAADVFVDDRHYLAPPAETAITTNLLVDREQTERGSVKVDDKIGNVQIEAQAWMFALHRISRYFTDPELTQLAELENLESLRSGGMALATAPFAKDWRWAASATFNRESVVVDDMNLHTWAAVIDSEFAGDLQYERKTIRVDAAAGIAIPAGVGADPWPEGKLQARWRPRFGNLELIGTLARKGRLPTLQDRFSPMTGNPSLGPEMVDDVEVRAIEQVDDRVRLEVAPFYKHSTGTIREAPPPAPPIDINLGKLDYYGIDMLGRVRPVKQVEVGGGWSYIRVIQEAEGAAPSVDDPLNRLPHNRWEAWAQYTPRPGLAFLARETFYGAFIDMGTMGEVHLPGYYLTSLTSTWYMPLGYLLVARIDDLLDARPQTRQGYYGNGRTLSVYVQGTF
jgi:hypothetical protein